VSLRLRTVPGTVSKELPRGNAGRTQQPLITVLSITTVPGGDEALFAHLSPTERKNVATMLDELHRHKIDLADEVLILNVEGYIGSATKGELAYAEAQGKRVRFLR
jgi:hypothetical protein